MMRVPKATVRRFLLGVFLSLLVFGMEPPRWAWGEGTPASGPFVETGRVGVGLDWDPGEFPSIPEYFVSFRDWVTDRFGIEEGIGMGFHPGTPGTTLVSFNTEGMVALVERRLTVFYLDATVTPALSTNPAVWPTTLQLSSGFGIEKVYGEIPALALNLQWNPLVVFVNAPNLPALNGFMNFFVGFHYYFGQQS